MTRHFNITSSAFKSGASALIQHLATHKVRSFKSCVYIYTGCFTTCGHYCRSDILGLFYQKSSYKHVSDFGRLRSYDRLKLRIEGNDY